MAMNAMMTMLRSVLCCGLACMALATAVQAQDKGDKAVKEQARRAQQQLRAAEKEKAELAQQKAALEAELKAAQGKVAELDGKAARAERGRAALAKELASFKTADAARAALLADEGAQRAAAERRVGATEKRLAEERAAFAAEKRRQDAFAAQLQAALAASRERNERMYKLGNDLVSAWEKKSCMTATLQEEPFTGLMRARIERMAEEEREKLDRERAPPAN
jgi:chromosome segregation ATPase